MGLNKAVVVITCALVLSGFLIGITEMKSDEDLCDHGPMDIIFVLDGSSSIWPVDFVTQLRFVENLTKAFNVGPDDSQTRVGLLTFSSQWKVEFNLNEKMDKSALARAIRRVRHLTGGTNTAEAINYVAHNMFLHKYGGRTNSTHIVIVITDGESYYKEETALASEKLREHGIVVFAIGVGFRVDLDELKSIANKPSEKFLLKVSDYQSLKHILNILTKRTCEVTAAPPIKIQRTTNPTLSTTTLSTTKTTTVPTSTKTSTMPTYIRTSTLPTYIRTSTLPTYIRTSTLPTYIRTSTLPLSIKTTTLPTSTAKTTTLSKSTTSTTSESTTVSTRSTTESTTIPVTLTSSTLTTDKFQADSERSDCGGKPADVFFLLDTSESILPSDFTKQLNFVRNVVENFDISPQKTRVGLSTFSHEYNPIFGLDTYQEKVALLNAISAVPYNGGGTDTGNAIKRMREYEFSRQFTRPEVAHVVVVLTDGLSRYPLETAKEADLTKKTGAYFFAVGIGSNVDQKELSNIASAPDSNFDNYAFHVNDFDGLKTLRNILAVQTCEIASYQRDETVCRTTKPSDVMFTYDAAFFGYKTSNIILSIIEEVSLFLATTGGQIKTGVQVNTCLKDISRPLSDNPLELLQDYDALPELISDMRTTKFVTRNGVRQMSGKIVVLFIDDLSKSAEIEIMRSKLRKINFIFVQIGSSITFDKLIGLAGKPHLVININPGEADTKQAVGRLKTILCEGF